MVPQTENFENISVNIYETGSFTKFDERDPATNIFDDINKSSFETYITSKNLNLDEIAVNTNFYLHKHYQKNKTLCRHISRFPTFTVSS